MLRNRMLLAAGASAGAGGPVYMYTQEITIPSGLVSSDLTNFPLVLTERDIDSGIWSYPSALVTVTDELDNELVSEIAWFDGVNQRMRIHVTIPTLAAASDTVILIKWGVSSSNRGTPFSTANYDYVIPFTVSSFADVDNFGSKTLNLTENGSPTYSPTTGVAIASSSQYFTQPITDANNIYYLSYKVRLGVSNQRCAGCVRFDDGSGLNLTVDNGTQVAMWDTENGWVDTSPVVNPLTVNPFAYQAFFEAGNERNVWYNGGNKGSDLTVTAFAQALNELRIGTNRNLGEAWTGDIYEARFAQQQFSDDWVYFEALNMGNSSDYSVNATVVQTAI